ncbi:hypothetical protein PpBr36_01543 [Pyricularia pennisetigena]|uniref:hypothetical protein n=1 Tax=Pyricularia pennisetigena TaxID=1578925 RepID=UPI00115358B8|nr:hypothetical protein PpBr36_01543 [Pyricularia pennisetigena]TLS29129.1 hypothetical protein PpBr36_01543 [Pyricularia pennisetigena]
MQESKQTKDKVSKRQSTVVEPGQFKEENPILTGQDGWMGLGWMILPSLLRCYRIRVYASPNVVDFFMDLVPARPISKFERDPECRQRQWRITVSSTWLG